MFALQTQFWLNKLSGCFPSHHTFTQRLSPPKARRLPGTFSSVWLFPGHSRQTIVLVNIYAMYPFASRFSFSEECILGATCTYLPESTRSGPCEGLLLSLSHPDGRGLLGVWYWVNTGLNWLKWDSDYLLKGLSAFFTQGSCCIDRTLYFEICFFWKVQMSPVPKRSPWNLILLSWDSCSH